MPPRSRGGEAVSLKEEEKDTERSKVLALVRCGFALELRALVGPTRCLGIASNGPVANPTSVIRSWASAMVRTARSRRPTDCLWPLLWSARIRAAAAATFDTCKRGPTLA